MSNYIYLNSKFDEYYVNEEAYAQICALVQSNKQCTYDYHHPYTEDNPCVGNNICLTHLLKKQRNLTYTGQSFQWTGGTSDGRFAYRFVDHEGYIYVSTEDATRDLQRSTQDTLSYYGFTPPEKVVSRGKSIDFYPHYATLYGDLKTASVIVLVYNHYSEKVKGLFLLYKNGPAKELSKKSDLYRNAEELVEASKDAHGQSHINGNVHTGRYDADVYEVISRLESAMYDVVLKLRRTDDRPAEQEV